MNGVSLLLLLSSLGATTSVELGSSGQAIYTIRIESLLINEMRQGQAIPIVVAAKDRRIRYFRIAIAPDGALRSNSTARGADLSARSGDLFDYEPTQTENGEIEYAVQIMPERLESLIAGKPIEGEIAADIPEVHRFLIFVGVGQLPSQVAASSTNSGNPPSLLNNTASSSPQNTAGVRPVDSQSRIGNPGTRPSFTQPAQPSTSRGLPTDSSTQYNSRPAEPRTAWRNGPDQSTIGPPPFTSTAQQTNPSFGSNFPRNSTNTAVTDRNTYGAPPATNSYPPQPQQPYSPGYQDPNAGYAHANQQTYGPGYATNPQVGYPQVAARPDPTLPPMPPNTAGNGWTQTVANQQPVAQQAVAPVAAAPVAATPTANRTTAAEPVERPWTPLIMTTLALFASLGANAYLGWLAWSFFWRFRDAVTESSRARSHQSSIRQAA